MAKSLDVRSIDIEFEDSFSKEGKKRQGGRNLILEGSRRGDSEGTGANIGSKLPLFSY